MNTEDNPTLSFFEEAPSAPVSIDKDASDDERAILMATKREEYLSSKQDREQRKDYAIRLYELVCCYLLFMFLLIVVSGLDIADFHLSDAVLVTLLGTTTATVLGLFRFVAKYLFRTK